MSIAAVKKRVVMRCIAYASKTLSYRWVILWNEARIIWSNNTRERGRLLHIIKSASLKHFFAKPRALMRRTLTPRFNWNLVWMRFFVNISWCLWSSSGQTICRKYFQVNLSNQYYSSISRRGSVTLSLYMWDEWLLQPKRLWTPW